MDSDRYVVKGGRLMGHPAGEKAAGRARLLAGAGRGFRRHGYGGLGVDALAREAGVTSGAFYAHFPSKADAFREAVTSGLRGLAELVRAYREREGSAWLERFIDFYVDDLPTRDLAEGCTLQSLSGEVARAGDRAREAYEAELRPVIEAVAGGLGGPEGTRRARAMAVLATLAGGVTLARAVRDPALAAEIGAGVRRAALAIAERDA